MADWAKIPEEAHDIINTQTVETRRFTYCDKNEYEVRREHEAANRNHLKYYSTNPYTVWMDHDVVPSDERQIERACLYLKDHDTIGGVAIDTKNTHIIKKQDMGHVVIAFVVMRGWIARALDYRPFAASGEKPCLCLNVNNDMKYRPDICMPLVYMPGERAIEIK